MGEIGNLPPVYRIPPTQPGAGNGRNSQAPQRKPPKDDGQSDRQRRRKKDDDDAPHIDEYA